MVISRTTSKILCRVDAKIVRGILSLPDSFPDNCESLNEPFLVEMYKNCETEVRCQFLSNILKEGQSLEGLFLPYNVNIFKKYVQLVMSLACQILGLDDDIHISEVVLGFLLRMSSINSESHLVHCFSLDEYFPEVIHVQLVVFPKGRFFKYQSYLLNMLLCSNVSELQFLSTIFSPDLPKQINMFEFVNTIMSEMYTLLFDEVLPRVLEEMKLMLQSSLEDRIGD